MQHPDRELIFETEKLQFSPVIIVIAGLPRTGKDSIARALTKRTNLVHFDVDSARYRGNPPSVIPPRGAEQEELNAMFESYRFNHQLAKEALQNGLPVILNATYSRAIYHDQLRILSREIGCQIVFFLLEAPDDVIQKRFESGQQSGFSNVTTFEQYESIRDRYQPYSDGVIRIDTSLPIDICIKRILEHIKSEI